MLLHAETRKKLAEIEEQFENVNTGNGYKEYNKLVREYNKIIKDAPCWLAKLEEI